MWEILISCLDWFSLPWIPGADVMSLCAHLFFFYIQIFEEEHSILYLDQGGVLVAMKHTSLPIRHLW